MPSFPPMILGRPDLAAAANLLANAKVFAACDRAASDNLLLHHRAIALELTAKSLHAAAGIPAVFRRMLGHDLKRCLALAAQLGLPMTGCLRTTIDALHPHFARGGFQRHPDRRWPTCTLIDSQIATEDALNAASKLLEPRLSHERMRARVSGATLSVSERETLTLACLEYSIEQIARHQGRTHRIVVADLTRALVRLSDDRSDL